MKQGVYLIHWKDEQAAERVDELRAEGFEVSHEHFKGLSTMRRWRDNPPEAFVIDLTHLPSHGREVALAIRFYKDTRRVPIIFVEGDPEKVERIKKLLPDAVYTKWSRIRSSLEKAISQPPRDPVKPKSLLEGYSGTPLPRKLGIKANAVVVLIDAPEGFEKTLGKLPDGVKLLGKSLGRLNEGLRVRSKTQGQGELVIWFTRFRKNLEQGIERIKSLVGKDGLWIAWPKKASRVASDLTQADVREVGLAAGLVDYKVCAVDATWSGLKFSIRRSKQAPDS